VVTPQSGASDTLKTLIYNVHIIDPGQQAVKINPGQSNNNHYVDNGMVACSLIELTPAGELKLPEITSDIECYTGEIDAHEARG
jgi:hypothetical protein